MTISVWPHLNDLFLSPSPLEKGWDEALLLIIFKIILKIS
jgi:hypothetical protein